MLAILETAGERVRISSSISWVDDLIAEATAGDLVPDDPSATGVVVNIESKKGAFDTSSWEPLTRGAWRFRDEVVVEDVCSTGFDLHVRCTPDDVEFTFRWRPQLTARAAAQLLRTRFTLLAREVLLQYPALWRASIRGRAPLHASVCTVGEMRPLLSGPGGVGKSTLMAKELAAGGRAISDNLCVSDGVTAWGVVEPMRVDRRVGRVVTYGRGEIPLPGRVAALAPSVLVVLRRGQDQVAHLRSCGTAAAVRSLVTGTYMAGELRRFWGLAATLTAGTGLGPAHPDVEPIARLLATNLPSVEISLPRQPGVGLAELLTLTEAIA
jgi:hypothetical protein